MQTKLTERFWEDDGIAALTETGKLAVVWLLTNSGVNVLGITNVTERKFQFDTGLPIEALWMACQALPQSFVRDGNNVLAVNFIRYQIGTGESLMANNLFATIKRTFQSISSESHRAALLAKVPELSITVALQSPSKPFNTPKPSPSPSKGKEKEKEDKKEKETVLGMGTGEGFCPADSEVLAFAENFAGELATGTPGPINPEFAAGWLARMLGRREFPPRWQRALVADWRAASRPSGLAAAPTGNGYQKKNGGESEAEKTRRSIHVGDLKKKLHGLEQEFNALDQCGAEVPKEVRLEMNAVRAELKELGE